MIWCAGDSSSCAVIGNNDMTDEEEPLLRGERLECSLVEYEPNGVQIVEKEWRDYVVIYTVRPGLWTADFEPPLFLRAWSRGIY